MKTWNDKLRDSKDLPKVVELSANAKIHFHAEGFQIVRKGKRLVLVDFEAYCVKS